jgi:mono/diheme cytochrome c family protein
MTHRIVLAFVVATAVVVAGCAPGDDAPDPEPSSGAVEVTPELLARGAETYKANCVPCHGPGGRGDGPSAATLKPPPRDHTNPELMETLSDKRIAETVRMGGIISGYPNMPASPHLRGEELVGLVAFVRSLHREEVESVDLEGVGQ